LPFAVEESALRSGPGEVDPLAFVPSWDHQVGWSNVRTLLVNVYRGASHRPVWSGRQCGIAPQGGSGHRGSM
jgi:hypothetical protein